MVHVEEKLPASNHGRGCGERAAEKTWHYKKHPLI